MISEQFSLLNNINRNNSSVSLLLLFVPQLLLQRIHQVAAAKALANNDPFGIDKYIVRDTLKSENLNRLTVPQGEVADLCPVQLVFFYRFQPVVFLFV